MIARIHIKPRRALFAAMKVAGGPRDAKVVGTTRLTICQFEDGEKFVVRDNLKTSRELHGREALHF